ncbi:flavodoxin family protein [Treponema sp. OMZ 803]|nr:hypothetical protein [Treponema sp. OMZ 803]UTC54127.1 flavodoxin family protein [Treponema sp. OMZ 803]
MAKILIAYFSHTGENYFGGQSVKEIRQLLQSLLKKQSAAICLKSVP